MTRNGFKKYLIFAVQTPSSPILKASTFKIGKIKKQNTTEATHIFLKPNIQIQV